MEVATPLVQLRTGELENRRLVPGFCPYRALFFRALHRQIEARLIDLQRRDAMANERIGDPPASSPS